MTYAPCVAAEYAAFCKLAFAQVPMLVLNTTHQLTFFNTDGPPIQKVTVTDVTGINANDFTR